MEDYKDSFTFRNERSRLNPRLKRGVIVGHIAQTTARLWIRAAEPGRYAFKPKDGDELLRWMFVAAKQVYGEVAVGKITFLSLRND